MEFRVYIANLGKYNEGEAVGEWFTPPVDWDDMKERIGLNDRYEEYAIHDYENCPVDIGEYTPISEVNRIAESIENLEEKGLDFSMIKALLEHYSSIEEVEAHIDDVYILYDCADMDDVARYTVTEYEVSRETLLEYFDYERYGEYLESTGQYVFADNCVIEIPY